MPRSLISELRTVNTRLLWCNVILLLCAVALGCLPLFLGLGYAGEISFWISPALPLAALALWNLRKWALRGQDPESHPFAMKIRNLGFGVFEAVEQDLSQADDFSCLTIGRAWILQRGFFDLQLAVLEDAVWAYMKDVQASYLLYYRGVIHLRSGKSFSGESTTDMKKVGAFLNALSQKAPWIIVGDNDDLQKLWKKERDGFVAQVDQRRKVLETQKSESPTF